ncbi:MAG: type I CRISPR-associated protein Cas7 [Akkermansiaceae bacterium]|nr:type I CRISPR-associated protein Cas7 [Akkermansiaceae bacterium]
MSNQSNEIPRVTGLLVIEARNSNPNGDPDRESDPRMRSHDGRGMISDVSFKRKLRELVIAKDGPVWQEMKSMMGLEDAAYGIHVDQNTRDKAKSAKKEGEKKDLAGNHWDVRVFGSTALEEKDNFIRTGVVQFGLGVSAAKIRIQRDTNTVKANVDAGKNADRGMAPLGFRVVEHGVYSMPFMINPTAAVKSGCEIKDIELLCRLIPYAYSHNISRVRPFVEVRHAWYFQHVNRLGSASDFAVIDSLTPSKPDPKEPSSAWDDYGYEGTSVISLARNRFDGRFSNFGDLCDPSFITQLFNPPQ